MPLLCWLLFFAVATADVQAAVAAKPEEAVPKKDAVALLIDKDFVYNGGNWPDPFVPFVKTEKAKKDEGSASEALAGMRRFEPGQLNLVAIVRQNGAGVAMVEDSAGKGYSIREGTPVGRFGVVTKISPGRVLITEKAPNPLGNTQEKTVTLELPGQ